MVEEKVESGRAEVLGESERDCESGAWEEKVRVSGGERGGREGGGE